jgi:hypothetical protein
MNWRQQLFCQAADKEPLTKEEKMWIPVPAFVD